MTAPLYAVVLAGGVGSRFWPLSTPSRPKQLLPLIGETSMLEDTVRRLEPLVGAAHILVLTSAALVPAIRRLLPRLAADQILEEPRPIGTAGALAWASVEVARRGGAEAALLSVHADWAIADEAAFRDTLAATARAAIRERSLATVGIVPTSPNPGLGYIAPGAPAGADARAVERFIEKPDVARAVDLVAAGALWNSGIFAWRAADYLSEAAALTPELSAALATVTPSSTAHDFFAAVTQPVSVDVGVLERSRRVIVVAGAFGWDDVGTWGALRRIRTRDAAGNAAHGRTHLVDAHDNVVHAEGSQVVLYGVRDLVVIVREGMTLVTTVERSDDLKALLDALPADVVGAV
ncbi:MAG: sugar phosphate nucleotidyltransferase [Gemmatimonadaceae bacterium]